MLRIKERPILGMKLDPRFELCHRILRTKLIIFYESNIRVKVNLSKRVGRYQILRGSAT